MLKFLKYIALVTLPIITFFIGMFSEELKHGVFFPLYERMKYHVSFIVPEKISYDRDIGRMVKMFLTQKPQDDLSALGDSFISKQKNIGTAFDIKWIDIDDYWENEESNDVPALQRDFYRIFYGDLEQHELGICVPQKARARYAECYGMYELRFIHGTASFTLAGKVIPSTGDTVYMTGIRHEAEGLLIDIGLYENHIEPFEKAFLENLRFHLGANVVIEKISDELPNDFQDLEKGATWYFRRTQYRIKHPDYEDAGIFLVHYGSPSRTDHSYSIYVDKKCKES